MPCPARNRPFCVYFAATSRMPRIKPQEPADTMPITRRIKCEKTHHSAIRPVYADIPRILATLGTRDRTVPVDSRRYVVDGKRKGTGDTDGKSR